MKTLYDEADSAMSSTYAEGRGADTMKPATLPARPASTLSSSVSQAVTVSHVERWKLTYVVNDGSGMFGLDVAPEHTVEAEIPSESMDEQAILEEMRAIVHRHADEHAVLTEAEKIEGD